MIHFPLEPISQLQAAIYVIKSLIFNQTALKMKNDFMLRCHNIQFCTLLHKLLPMSWKIRILQEISGQT